MAKDYKIEYYPKYRNEDSSKLSAEQIALRKRSKRYVYNDKKSCNTCGKKQSINEFYIKDRETGRRANKCRDCSLKQDGVVEVGKVRFAMKIMEKGFRRCHNCKDIKPITEFLKHKNKFGGYSHTCKKCGYNFHRNFLDEQKDTIGDHYVKQYALYNYRVKISSDKEINKYREEIIERRKPKYHIDKKSFITLRSFAEYILEKYKQPITQTEKRISTGHSEEECKLSESEMRSLAYTKGKIKVTDTITGKEMIFANTMDKKLKKMFSDSTITKAIVSGKKTRITSLSKYKNPCTIQRI